eukprot:gene12021-14061_t
MDARSMSFDSCAFDSVFDKGTIDAVMCSDEDNSNVIKMVAEVSRVLKPGGFFLSISYGSPESRMPILDKPEHRWKIYMRMLGTHKDAQMNECHYIYVMQKDVVLDGAADAPVVHDPNTEIFEVYLNGSLGKIPLEIAPIVVKKK